MITEIFRKILLAGMLIGTFYLGFVSPKSDEGIFITRPDQAVAKVNLIQQIQPVKIISEDNAVISAIQKSSPAVVSIVESAEMPKIEMCAQNDPNSDSYFTPYLCQTGTEMQRVGAGSGFIVSSDGYIVTNNHVVDNPTAKYTVLINIKNKPSKVEASILARDAKADVAILKINVNDLPYLTFADSNRLQVGQTAIAIGYALGQFDNSVSKGVISGLSRSIEASDSTNANTEMLTGLVQTDAAINPGNSGGPLLDINGNVVAMNVAMADAQNIGFAVPGNVVLKDYQTVRNTGELH